MINETLYKGEMLMYNVIDVAKYIIFFCKKNGYSISNLKLQKLLYFVQAQFLVTLGQPAFSETIEAWDFGPVVPAAYHYFKIWGNAEIPAIFANDATKKIYISDQKIMDGILKLCACYSASYLVDVTHNQSPWLDAYKKYCNNKIDNESIKEFFSKSEC